MTTGQVHFNWHIAPSGYLVEEAVPATAPPTEAFQPALVPAPTALPPASWPPAAYDPALFRTFADLVPEPEAIKAFADRHGDLDGGVELFVRWLVEARPGELPRGNFLSTWQMHITRMKRLTDLWDLLRADDAERIAAYIRWTGKVGEGAAVYFVQGGGAGKGRSPSRHGETWDLIASRDHRHELLAQLKRDDPLTSAWAYLQQQLDDRLKEVAADTSASMSWDASRGRPSFRVMARTLVAAVWLQIADAVGNDRNFNRCPGCGRWTEVGPADAKAHRKHCSDACRMKALRQRQDRARQLHTTGKSFEQIAEELGADVASVKRWVTGFKG
jgi:hypothetical protein